jgi:hypothetical protein
MVHLGGLGVLRPISSSGPQTSQVHPAALALESAASASRLKIAMRCTISCAKKSQKQQLPELRRQGEYIIQSPFFNKKYYALLFVGWTN